MSKLGEIHDMAMRGKKAELIDWLEMRMSKSAARHGANEFMKAAEEIKKKEEIDLINKMNDAVQSTPEYKIGKNVKKWTDKLNEKK
jgi:hypothetical protein